MAATALTPSQQRLAAEQAERNERIDAYIDAIAEKFVNAPHLEKSNGACKSACAAPDLIFQISILLKELEEVGLLRRRADVEHVSSWLESTAFHLKPALAVEMLEATEA